MSSDVTIHVYLGIPTKWKVIGRIWSTLQIDHLYPGLPIQRLCFKFYCYFSQKKEVENRGYEWLTGPISLEKNKQYLK